MSFQAKLGINPSHGTRSRYVIGCRCDECKSANAEAARIRDERAREAVAHLPLNPGGPCPGFDGKPCAKARRLKSNSGPVCKDCLQLAAWDGLVDATPVREHLLKLSAQGVGYKSVGEAADVGKTSLFRVMTGQKTRIRKRAADRVLAVDAQAVADWGLVPAGETRRMLRALEEEWLTKGALALELGYAQPALQIGQSSHVRARTEHRVKRLYRRIAG
jgi:hypothetical protein